MRTLLLLLFTASALLGADISGRWNFNVDTSAGSGSPQITFRVDGEKLSGNYSGALGEAPITGTLKGKDLEFSFEVTPQGDKIRVVYKGKVESDTKMAGSVSVPGLAEGTWTAEKAK
jgi:hypothetical protein